MYIRIYVYTSVDPPHIHVAGYWSVVQRDCRAEGRVGGFVRIPITIPSEFRSQFRQTFGPQDVGTECKRYIRVSMRPSVRLSVFLALSLSICPYVRM